MGLHAKKTFTVKILQFESLVIYDRECTIPLPWERCKPWILFSWHNQCNLNPSVLLPLPPPIYLVTDRHSGIPLTVKATEWKWNKSHCYKLFWPKQKNMVKRKPDWDQDILFQPPDPWVTSDKWFKFIISQFSKL